MSEFLPLLFLILIVALLNRATKGNKKGNGKTGTTARTTAQTAARTERQPPSSPGPAGDRQLEMEFPHLFRQMTDADATMTQGNASSAFGRERSNDWRTGSLEYTVPEGTVPCHDKAGTMRSGSLEYSIPEGTDPCHDEPRTMRSGSLEYSIPEGTDPCHDEVHTARADSRFAHPVDSQERSDETETGGLNLAWTGDEIVKGFIYGEVLNRKRAEGLWNG